MSKARAKTLPAPPGLTPEQVSEGMRACRENAKRLITDAQHLLERGSHASALFFATIAQEELGKRLLIAIQGMVSFGDKEKAQAWAELLSHGDKLAIREAPALAATAARYGIAEMRAARQLADSHHREKLDALYVGRFSGGGWPRPEESTTPEEVAIIVSHVETQIEQVQVDSPADLARTEKKLIELGFLQVRDLDEAAAQFEKLASSGDLDAVMDSLADLGLKPRKGKG